MTTSQTSQDTGGAHKISTHFSGVAKMVKALSKEFTTVSDKEGQTPAGTVFYAEQGEKLNQVVSTLRDNSQGTESVAVSTAVRTLNAVEADCRKHIDKIPDADVFAEKVNGVKLMIMHGI